MASIISYSKAKCKDCKFCQCFFKGKLKRHRCVNPESGRYWDNNPNKTVGKNDIVCNKWKLI